jgi:hypothetical protein
VADRVGIVRRRPALRGTGPGELFFACYRHDGAVAISAVAVMDAAFWPTVNTPPSSWGCWAPAWARCVGGRRRDRPQDAGAGVSAGVPAVAYLASSVFPQVQGLAWTREASPWRWYLGGEPLKHGLQAGDSLWLLVVTVVLVAAGTWIFSHRDVAV